MSKIISEKIVLEFLVGTDFREACDLAYGKARTSKQVVEFNFNGDVVSINPTV